MEFQVRNIFNRVNRFFLPNRRNPLLAQSLGKVLGGEHFPAPRLLDDEREKLLGYRVFEQPVAVLAEHCWVPNRFVGVDSDKLSEQEVLLPLFH